MEFFVVSSFATGISLGQCSPPPILELSEVAMAAACAFRAEEMPSLISCRMASKVMTGVSDVDFFWNKEYRGLNSSDGGYYKRLIQFAGGGDFSEEFKRTASDKAGR
ncbi:hypothetical protein Tco_0701603 [Tanacetum coccineum]